MAGDAVGLRYEFNFYFGEREADHTSLPISGL
jgi:hypothetical protein